MKHMVGNLFDLMQKGDAMVHGCNAQGVMGSGIALEVKQRYPGAFNAYELTHRTEGLELGKVIPYFDAKAGIWIINGITQNLYGRNGSRFASYDAIAEVFKRVKDAQVIGGFDRLFFPLIGAGLGGGDWEVIKAIIESELKDAQFESILVTLPRK